MKLRIPIVTRKVNMSRVSLRHVPENDNPKRPTSRTSRKSKTNLMSMKRKAPTTMTKKMRMKNRRRKMILRAVLLLMLGPSLLSHLSQVQILTYHIPSSKKNAIVSEGESRDKRGKSVRGALAKSPRPKKVLI